MFKRYQHIEKLGTSETDGILDGLCYIFPKIDGANASVWKEGDGQLRVGSRNRDITGSENLKGLHEYVCKYDGMQRLLADHPSLRPYGEWLIPHTFKDYRTEAWNKFYVFDCEYADSTSGYLLDYRTYTDFMQKYGIEFIPPLAIIDRPSMEQLMSLVESNNYLVQDGKGPGEGIVIKRYDFVNRYGRTTWAKIVRSEFKDHNRKAFGPRITQGPHKIETDISNEPGLSVIVQKVYANIRSAKGGWEGRFIPMLLGTVWHEFVTEEVWSWMKKYRTPTIDFKVLQRLVETKVKETLPEIFK
jgi:hypothetical protein